jgi:hypothetical protein
MTPIICTLPLLSFVLCTLQSVPVAQVCCANLQPAFKLLVAMDLSFSSIIPFLIRSSINTGHPACFSFTFRICVLSMIFSASSGAIHCVKADCHWSYCKSVNLISSCHLHCFQSLLKVFGGHCRLAFWMNYFFLQSTFSFGISSYRADFLTVPKFPIPRRKFPLYFATAPSFPTVLEFSVSFPYRVKSPGAVCHRDEFPHCRALMMHHELL